MRACDDFAQAVQNQMVISSYTSHVTRHTSHVTRHTSQVTHSVACSLQGEWSNTLPPLPEFIDRFESSASASASASALLSSSSSVRQRLIKIQPLPPPLPSLTNRSRGPTVRYPTPNFTTDYSFYSTCLSQGRGDHLLLQDAAASALKRAKLAM